MRVHSCHFMQTFVGSFSANGQLWVLLQRVHKRAKLLLISGDVKRGPPFIYSSRLQWSPGSRAHLLTAFMGPVRKASSGRGTGEAAASMLTLSKNFTASCQISRFPPHPPSFFSHMGETLTGRSPTPLNSMAKLPDCGGVIILTPSPPWFH